MWEILRAKLGLQGRVSYSKSVLAVLGVFWACYRPAITKLASKNGLEHPTISLKILKRPVSLIQSKPSLDHD